VLKEYRTLVPYLRKYALRYAVGFIVLVTVDLTQLIIPQIIKRAVDSVSSGAFILADIGKLALLIVAVAAFISLGRFVWRRMIFGAARSIEAELRERLFRKYMELSGSFYLRNKIGDLMARATNDISQVRQSAGMGFVSFTDGFFMLFGILIVMFLQNARIALLTVIPLPVITVLIIVFGGFVGRRFERVQAAFSRMSDIAQETMAGVRVVKAFVREKAFLGRFASANDEYRAANMTLTGVFGFFFPLIAFLSGITMLILIIAGGRAVISNGFSAGDVVAMLAYLEMLIWPVMGAGFMVNMIQRGGASLKRINEILDEKPDIGDRPGAAAGRPAGSIEFRGLSFRYGDSGSPALEGISFSLARGERLGILGRTGSGKSTLLKLLPRLIEAPPLSLFVGGREAAEWSLSSLRTAFAFVPQDSFLFSASIRDNIAFGRPGLGEEDIARLVSSVRLERDLEQFPAGLDTLVGEKGLSLSGGQKQRVALARALALDSEILVLDDAFSAVDTETEEGILAALLGERRGRTTIIVSHRVSTLRHADRIIVLEGGKIVQDGSHGELLAREDGLYAEIAGLQALDENEGAGRG
jgi:ATP-binding cassette, subfamily B, multidrug efflux pump